MKSHISKGYRRIKVGPNYVAEHRHVWEKKKGKIPVGKEIHHKDGNKLNNKIENLQLVNKKEHAKIHMPERVKIIKKKLTGKKHKKKIIKIPENMKDFELLTLRQASDLLRVHPNTLRKWEEKGRIKSKRVGTRMGVGDRRFLKKDILKLIK